ncbi:MAG: NAD-dependent protein deacylase [Treponema sp.]|nr:NAD-dependent protein deacylase [Treponema sp.]MBR4386073.1 NAD-dependent protein deacylase [Treponema sp.]
MDKIEELQEYVDQAKNIVFFGGAGVSTESGIPDFRSVDGLYNQKWDYPPEEILSANFFYSNPKEFYRFYREKILVEGIKPNAAHLKLAELEQKGKLSAVITQNIDGLHQAAGSKNVLELHGSVLRNHCPKCGSFYDLDYMIKHKDSHGLPICKTPGCESIIKPDVVLYGENLDEDVISKTLSALRSADLLIIGGTSLTVYPAAGFIRAYTGDRLVLINRDATTSDSIASLVIHDSIGKVLSQIKA